MDMENVLRVVAVSPDSHFRLRACEACGGDNLGYVEKQGEEGTLWHVRCFGCGKESAQRAVRHDAQAAWNRGVKNEYE